MSPPPEGEEGGGKLSTARSKLECYYLHKIRFSPPEGDKGAALSLPKWDDSLYFLLDKKALRSDKNRTLFSMSFCLDTKERKNQVADYSSMHSTLEK